MKLIRRDNQIFSLALLDVVSCGFGAVVLLILISRTGVSPEPSTVDTAALLGRTFAVEQELRLLDDLLNRERLKLAESLGNNEQARLALQRLATNTAAALAQEDALAASTDTLEQRGDELDRTIQLSRDDAERRDEEVGGIPVDSDYVIFVIDTSSSMRRIWSSVTRELDAILTIHPTVSGFQVINDNGVYLFPGTRGTWLADTPARRAQAFARIRGWGANSNSSPLEGMSEALSRYGAPTASRGGSLALYVLGDDYSGDNYDRDLALINQLNRDRSSGARLARIHALGFLDPNRAKKFSTLLREVAMRNDGTFLAIRP